MSVCERLWRRPLLFGAGTLTAKSWLENVGPWRLAVVDTGHSSWIYRATFRHRLSEPLLEGHGRTDPASVLRDGGGLDDR